jgi:Protein of unknown function (DUF2950)
MLQSNRTKENGRVRSKGIFIAAAVLAFVFAAGSVYAKPRHQKGYSTPEEAVKAMVEAVKSGNTKLLLKIFGPGSKALVLSGDPVQDKEGRDRFVKHYEEKNRLEEASGKALLYLGNDDWPFPIPLVKTEKGWKFDAKAGRQEILARRVGRNELNAIQVCLAYVDAQKEYALRKARQGKALLEYAQDFVSTPGRQDGLYWQAGEGQEQSPMGPLFAAARESGYGGEPLGETPTPYHGYLYRILKAQGENAPGGARDYVVEGKMIGGFALIAFPAKYGSSGVMTFIVNQNGVVFQKDLGKKTREEARTIMAFDPDETWKPVQE